MKKYCVIAKMHTPMFIEMQTDKGILEWAKPLNDMRRGRSDWRDVRRKAIREALRRGLIDRDPCDAP